MSKKPENARAAGLRYRSDSSVGIRRVRTGSTFRYLDRKGRRIRDEATLVRIRSLAIPPAWVDVWISPDSKSHLQATGRDARGRKQYRYHAKWREVSHRIHPAVLDAYADGTLGSRLARARKVRGLNAEEAAVLAVIETQKTWKQQLEAAARIAKAA